MADALSPVRSSLQLPWADPIDHGAVPDGVTDCTDAIQAAVDTGLPVQMRPGLYRVTRPIDLTLGTAEGVQFSGAGAGESGTVLIGDTGGKPVLDLTANKHTTLRAFSIKPGTVDPSTIGVMYARNAALWQSSYNAMENVTVYLHGDEAANGGRGTVGVYNVSGEIFTAVNCRFRADTGLWLDRTNSLDVASDYTPTQAAGQFSSMSVVRLVGGYLVGISGPGLYAHQAADIRLDCGISLHGDVTQYPSAVVARGGLSGLSWTGSVDGYRTAIDTDNWVTGFHISPYITPVAGWPLLLGSAPGSGFRQGTISINPANGAHIVTDLFAVDAAVGHGALWVVQVLARGGCTSIDMPHPSSTMQAVRILSDKTLDDWSITCLEAQRQNVVLSCRDGTVSWGEA